MEVVTTSVKNKNFLKNLDLENLKTTYIRITVMTMSERPIKSIEGRITNGSISISASSSVRRTCNLTFVTDEDEYDYIELDGLLSMNKKISVLIGIENNIDEDYPEIIWFKQGIFIINNLSISHGTQGIQISLQCKDKMCLLNGECGGGLPTSITFHEYDQLDENGKRVPVKQLIFDIIQTLVVNWGGENESNVFINDIPKQIKQLVRFTGVDTLYYNSITNEYTMDADKVAADTGTYQEGGTWRAFNYNEDVGYTYTDFTYPGELISNIGDNVCSVLDTIVSALGNYEYFYDVDGHFIFQEIRNYLNTSYSPISTQLGSEYKIDPETGEMIFLDPNNLSIIDDTNYKVDYNSNSKSVYVFNEGNGLISSYTNNPNYANMKNDYHIWGKNSDGYAIHYHLAIKEKPTNFNKYLVKFLKDENDKFDGRIAYLESYINDENFSVEYDEETGDYTLVIPPVKNYKVVKGADGERTLVCTRDAAVDLETLYLTERVKDNVYIPTDWRAELYLQGLMKQSNQQRPDIYEQELLDNFDSIYNFYEPWYDESGEPIYHTYIDPVTGEEKYIETESGQKLIKRGKFKQDIVHRTNNLSYFMDYLEPKNKYEDCSIDAINTRIYSFQEDKICKLYNSDVPNIIILNAGASSDEELEKYQNIRARCISEGQTFSNVSGNVYSNLAEGTIGYSAQETVRDLLYQYTNLNETISLQSIPIYYLDVNTRITVQDKAAAIYGDYVIQSISLSFGSGQMSISASKALERI